MDAMTEQEADIHNFSTSSSHRLPTISGTQALQNELSRARGIPTSLSSLDEHLSPNASPSTNAGMRRGHVTEIYGPPGVGKTTFGLQVAVNAIRFLPADFNAVWISTGAPLVRDRLNAIYAGQEFVEGIEPPSSPPQPGLDTRSLDHSLICLQTHSLPRLLTLLMHPTSTFPPASTSVMIVDDLSNLILGSFPRHPRNRSATSTMMQDKLAQRATSRRFQVIENLASSLTRLAASRHIAVVILNNAAISLKAGQKAQLKPALSGQAWDAAINTRIVLLRDFAPADQRTKLSPREKKGFRLAAVSRLKGRDVYREAVPFVIENYGLRQLASCTTIRPSHPTATAAADVLAPTEEPPRDQPIVPPPSSPPLEPFQRASQLPHADDTRPTKRKATEIADSEDENEDEGQDNDAITGDDETLDPPPLQDEDEMLLDAHGRSFIENPDRDAG